MRLLLIAFAFICVLTGCTYTSHVSTGTPFPLDKVSQIKKGQTTKQQLEGLFGQPFSKSIINETDEKWLYSYVDGSASAQAFTMKTTSVMTQHTLDILLSNGVVINFAETNSPLQYTNSIK
jgi:outer membrane protein assembly factor BamE (lipoprotein component of BamABCDE complex)